MHGYPVWFELATDDLSGAGAFYAHVLGWRIADSGMAGLAYHLVHGEGGLAAGLTGGNGMPGGWTLYVGVDDADGAASAIAAAGGRVLHGPADIPGTGRFALAADPQGVRFGILRPDPMDRGDAARAFDQQRAGHGNWTELTTPDPEAALRFYAALFGWEKGQAMDMGAMGTYRIFRHDGADIGGAMGLGDGGQPRWLVYFGVNGVNDAAARIADAGGTVRHGPSPVPGDAHILIATDPHGAWFAVVGPLETVP